MAKTAEITFYMGLEANLPVLENGEPAWTTDTHKVWVGQGGVNYEVGAGSGAAAQENTSRSWMGL